MTPKDTKNLKIATQLMTKASSAIVLDDPFYGYMLLRHEVTPDFTCDTAWINGVTLGYNPNWIASQTLSKVKGLIKHEIMHVVGMHHLRKGTRDNVRWNRAADFAINGLLVDNNVDLPEGGCYDAKYKDMSAEHVYSLLPENDDDGGGGGLAADGSFAPPWNIGEVRPNPHATDESSRRQAEEDVRMEVIQAANTAKMMGRMPAGLDRLIDDIRASKMPWQQILARFFRSTAKDDASWRRPNRRYLASGVYLPSLHSESMGPLVIGIDTSGSIGPELNQFVSEVNKILRTTKPEAIHVVYCDAAVGNTQVFKPSDLPLRAADFAPSGGGGTDFRPVFEYVAEKRLKPVALLYFTDMCGSFPDKAPAYPTIWCATTQVVAPFGRTLQLN